jgi:hypothetical protein
MVATRNRRVSTDASGKNPKPRGLAQAKSWVDDPPNAVRADGPSAHLSTGAEVEDADFLAAGELADFGHDGIAVYEELVADDGVRDQDGQAAALNDDGVGVGGIGSADELGPLVANDVFGRITANVVLVQQLLHQGTQRLDRALDLTARFRKRHVAQVADEFLCEFAEMVGLRGHRIL